MKKNVLGVAASLALVSVTPSSAALFVQEVPLSFSASGTTATAVLTDSDDMTVSFNPFNASLGTLNSFRVEWSVTYQLNFVNNSNGATGTISAGGNYSLAGRSYDGNGDGDGNSGPSGVPLSAGFTVSNNTLFPVADAGVTYDPGLLTAVTGASPFNALWNSATTPSFQDVTSWSASAIGSVKLTYDYTAVPEPADAGIAAGVVALGAVLGLRRLKRRGQPGFVAR